MKFAGGKSKLNTILEGGSSDEDDCKWHWFGTVFGACVGAFLLKFLDNGLVMARLDVNWFRFAVGTLLIVAVILNTNLRRLGSRMKE